MVLTDIMGQVLWYCQTLAVVLGTTDRATAKLGSDRKADALSATRWGTSHETVRTATLTRGTARETQGTAWEKVGPRRVVTS